MKKTVLTSQVSLAIVWMLSANINIARAADDPKLVNADHVAKATTKHVAKKTGEYNQDHYFERDREYIEISVGGLVGILRAKERLGSAGPGGTIEASPWVKSLDYLTKIPLGQKFDFVFNCTGSAFYVRCPPVYAGRRFNIGGHVMISHQARISAGCGGEFWKVSDNPLIFRSNELSGHRGLFWNDQRRFSFLELARSLGIAVYHEPYTFDNRKMAVKGMPEIVDKFIPYGDAESQSVQRFDLFARLSIEDLKLFQENFLRKFGNSIFNPAFFLSVMKAPYACDTDMDLYLYDKVGDGHFRLKREFLGKGGLDKKFNFTDPNDLERVMIEDFTTEYSDSK